MSELELYFCKGIIVYDIIMLQNLILMLTNLDHKMAEYMSKR